MEINKEILKGYIDIILVSRLRKKAMYGYELSKEILKISNDSFEIKEGSLYLSLKRLEKSGYLKSFWANETSGGGRRKYYEITDLGIDFLNNKKEEWLFFKEVIDKFLEV
ncbi:PadR family transcriptional regulator [Wukongibacter baidiensis]|uniref:PadR family transcriptional regulator n=1 Tax=Wukongibacter baidiensis TaxID=1723361 RepID=UPI003D7F7CF7